MHHRTTGRVSLTDSTYLVDSRPDASFVSQRSLGRAEGGMSDTFSAVKDLPQCMAACEELREVNDTVRTLLNSVRGDITHSSDRGVSHLSPSPGSVMHRCGQGNVLGRTMAEMMALFERQGRVHGIIEGLLRRLLRPFSLYWQWKAQKQHRLPTPLASMPPTSLEIAYQRVTTLQKDLAYVMGTHAETCRALRTSLYGRPSPSPSHEQHTYSHNPSDGTPPESGCTALDVLQQAIDGCHSISKLLQVLGPALNELCDPNPYVEERRVLQERRVNLATETGLYQATDARTRLRMDTTSWGESEKGTPPMRYVADMKGGANHTTAASLSPTQTTHPTTLDTAKESPLVEVSPLTPCPPHTKSTLPPTESISRMAPTSSTFSPVGSTAWLECQKGTAGTTSHNGHALANHGTPAQAFPHNLSLTAFDAANSDALPQARAVVPAPAVYGPPSLDLWSYPSRRLQYSVDTPPRTGSQGLNHSSSSETVDHAHFYTARLSSRSGAQSTSARTKSHESFPEVPMHASVTAEHTHEPAQPSFAPLRSSLAGATGSDPPRSLSRVTQLFRSGARSARFVKDMKVDTAVQVSPDDETVSVAKGGTESGTIYRLQRLLSEKDNMILQLQDRLLAHVKAGTNGLAESSEKREVTSPIRYAAEAHEAVAGDPTVYGSCMRRKINRDTVRALVQEMAPPTGTSRSNVSSVAGEHDYSHRHFQTSNESGQCYPLHSHTVPVTLEPFHMHETSISQRGTSTSRVREVGPSPLLQNHLHPYLQEDPHDVNRAYWAHKSAMGGPLACEEEMDEAYHGMRGARDQLPRASAKCQAPGLSRDHGMGMHHCTSRSSPVFNRGGQLNSVTPPRARSFGVLNKVLRSSPISHTLFPASALDTTGHRASHSALGYRHSGPVSPIEKQRQALFETLRSASRVDARGSYTLGTTTRDSTTYPPGSAATYTIPPPLAQRAQYEKCTPVVDVDVTLSPLTNDPTSPLQRDADQAEVQADHQRNASSPRLQHVLGKVDRLLEDLYHKGAAADDSSARTPVDGNTRSNGVEEPLRSASPELNLSPCASVTYSISKQRAKRAASPPNEKCYTHWAPGTQSHRSALTVEKGSSPIPQRVNVATSPIAQPNSATGSSPLPVDVEAEPSITARRPSAPGGTTRDQLVNRLREEYTALSQERERVQQQTALLASKVASATTLLKAQIQVAVKRPGWNNGSRKQDARPTQSELQQKLTLLRKKFATAQNRIEQKERELQEKMHMVRLQIQLLEDDVL